MTFHNLHIIDIAIIIGYLAVCLFIGFLTSKKIKNIRDYAIGSGHISTAVLVGTFFATDIGAGATIGVIEKIQTMGIIFVIAALFRPLFWLITSYIFSRGIDFFKKAGCISISDIMEITYGKTARWITNIVALADAIGVITLQVVALSYLFQYFLGISATYCAVASFAILVIYSFLGGIRAVALTDVIQAIVFCFGIPIACFIALDVIDVPLATILETFPKSNQPLEFSTSNIILIGSMVMHYALMGTAIPFVQRYLMANNGTQLRRALFECFWITIPFILVIVMAGVIVAFDNPDVNANAALYYLIDSYIPIGLKGVLVAGLIAVIMSTADSWINTASVICAHDIVAKIYPKIKSHHELLIGRLSVLLIGMIAVLLAFSYKDSVMSLAWLTGAIWKPVIAVPLIFAFFKLESRTSVLITAIVFGISGVITGWYIAGEMASVSMAIGVLFSAIGLLGAHYYSRGFAFKAPRLQLPVLGWRGVLNFSENQVRIHGHNHFLAGGLGIMYFISSIFLYNPHSSSGLLLAVRSISALLSLGLLFHERIGLGPARQKYLSLYYHIVLMVIFPLISGYMMLLSGFSAFWVVSFAIAIVMMNFMCGITMTALLTPIGLLGAHILWKKSGGYVLPIPASMVHIGFTVILLVITARVRHNFQRSMIEIKDMYSTMLAHQVMQPIAQVSMVAEHAASVLAPHVHNEDLQEVAKQLTSLQKIGHKGTELVNGLLMMSRDDIEKAQDRGAYYIQDVINTALLTYSEKQLSRIKVDRSSDFRFNGSKMFMVEVIRNLISNSFKYAGPKAEIEVFCGPRALYISDNGRGIESERLPYIFDHTRNSNGQTTGTGFGLAFVKRVVDTFSCSIICRSELGKYTEFVIGFPRL